MRKFKIEKVNGIAYELNELKRYEAKALNGFSNYKSI